MPKIIYQSGPKIRYRSGYKYQLEEDYSVQIEIYPPAFIETNFIELTTYGLLTGKCGFAWDGPSGPARDTKNFMKGSLVHDMLARLMRQGLIGGEWLKYSNQLLYQICRDDGMSRMRARWVYAGLVLARDSFSRVGTEPSICEAP